MSSAKSNNTSVILSAAAPNGAAESKNPYPTRLAGGPPYLLALLLRVPRPCVFCKGGGFDLGVRRSWKGYGRSAHDE
jgi:hypothetical protein